MDAYITLTKDAVVAQLQTNNHQPPYLYMQTNPQAIGIWWPRALEKTP
jgi:hypothetical protein